ncbi:uncharacterized protein LOC110177369 isoform X2 [Drosophila serrata]|uniref:uncharacterized protein LOC110177369 isoform X2 n=1 Tax=Drosophila serrata TaxID=7274 RepID=UPI000A1D2F0C|nr:uncharacterized protein LOC110177369 isoform X2 [Drosophila serrata]
MLKYLIVLVFLLNSGISNGSLCVTNVVVRVPREKDIGLIFDLTVTNSMKNERREMLDFMVSSDGECTLNTTRGELVQSMGRIFGGNFGAIEPGKTESVSLVWPTLSLYNRVGSCPIQLTVTSVQDSIASTKQLLHFDTRFEVLDPNGHSLRKRKDFVDCRNWDKDYFRNCTPLNCEERYFGQRSFYNQATEQCEQVQSSSRPGEFYDIYSNEAIDRNNFVTDKELEEIKQGKYDSNYLELQGPATHLLDEKKEKAMEKQVRKKSSLEVSMLSQLYYDWYLPLRTETQGGYSEIEDGGTTLSPESVPSSSQPLIDWPSQLDSSGLLLLFVKGLAIILSLIMFQIVVTLTAYFVVCLSVYGFIELCGLWKSKDKEESLAAISESSQTEIYTTESLISHR